MMTTPKLSDLIKTWLDSKSIQYTEDKYGFMINGIQFIIEVDKIVANRISKTGMIWFYSFDCRKPNFFAKIEKLITGAQDGTPWLDTDDRFWK